MTDITLAITYFGLLLGLGVIVASALRKLNIPDTFFLMILGLILGPTVLANPWVTNCISVNYIDVSAMGDIPNFLRILALVIIVFTGAFHLKLRTFQRFSNVSVKFAVMGFIFSIAFLGFSANLLFGLGIVTSLLLASIISGTATDVILPMERSLKYYGKSLSILKVESILNSPLTVLFPLLFIDLIKIEPGALLEPLTYASQFWLMIAAGVGTGMVIGLAVGQIVKKLGDYTVLTLMSVALITYALAENVGGSGMLAVAIAGIIIGNMKFREKEEVETFENQLSEMLRISVFTLLGASVTIMIGLNEFLLILLFFMLIVLSRPIFIVLTIGKLKDRLTRKDLLLLAFVAPRGLASAAMAPIVAAALIAVKPDIMVNQMVNIIFLSVLFSVLLSTVVAYLLGRSKNKPRTEKKKPVEKEFPSPEPATQTETPGPEPAPEQTELPG